MATRNYAAIARRYAEAVVGGDIAACKWVRLACQRQLDDLERFKGRNPPYRFNPRLTDKQGRSFQPADNLCAFVERLPHVKGPLAGNPIVLEPWQVFVLTTLFGWVKPDGKRRFRRAYVEVPRGNGKALAADTLIPTPTGFRPMADLKVGDQVFDEKGSRLSCVLVTVPIGELVRDVLCAPPCVCDEAAELCQCCIFGRTIQQNACLDVPAHRCIPEIWAPDHAADALPVAKQVDLRVEQVAARRDDGRGR